MTAEWDDLARLADAAPVQHQRLRVGGEGSEGTRVYPDTGDKRTDIRALLVVNGLGQPEDGQMARFIAAANPATILRLISELRKADAYRALYDHVVEEWNDVADEVARTEAERDALAARLAAVEAEAATHDRGRGECACALCAALAAPTDTTKETS